MVAPGSVSIIIGQKAFHEELFPNAGVPFNTRFYDPTTGEHWATVFRSADRWWTYQPARLDGYPTWCCFPAYVPKSLIGAIWADGIYLWSELGHRALLRELDLFEGEFRRLTSPTLSLYNDPTIHLPDSKMNQEIMMSLAQARLKLARGEMSTEELREALKLLRQHRVSASAASANSKAAKAPVDTNALLNTLIG